MGPRQHFDVLYSQDTGGLYLCDESDNRVLLAFCYSGAPGFVNDGSKETEIGKGPIPRGLWRMDVAYHDRTKGPCTIPLFAIRAGASPDGFPYGRSGFLIHGDNRTGNRSASRGCIIAPRYARECIAALIKYGFLHRLLVEE